MLDGLSQAADYRDPAEECRRLATVTFLAQMRNRYSQMADEYCLLATVEEPRTRSSAAISRHHDSFNPPDGISRAARMRALFHAMIRPLLL
jgi:hypothetical protein